MKISVFETFSGIGAQHKALDNLKSKNILDYEIVGTSDWDVFATVSYAAIHHPNFIKEIKNPSIEELDDFLKNHQFSFDGKKEINNINRISDEAKIIWYKAFKITNNISSVVNSFERVKKMIGLKISIF